MGPQLQYSRDYPRLLATSAELKRNYQLQLIFHFVVFSSFFLLFVLHPPNFGMSVEHGPHQGGTTARHSADEDQRHVPVVRIGLLVAAHDTLSVRVHEFGCTRIVLVEEARRPEICVSCQHEAPHEEGESDEDEEFLISRH